MSACKFAVFVALFAFLGVRSADAFEGITFAVGEGPFVAEREADAEWPGRTVDRARGIEEFTLPGVLFDRPIAIAAEARADRRSLRGLLARDYAANLSGDPEAIVENFDLSDREDIRRLFGHPKVMAANTGFFRSLEELSFDGIVLIRGYVVAIVSYHLADGRFMRTVSPMVRVDDQYFRTNALSDDPVFGMVLAAVRDNAMRPARR